LLDGKLDCAILLSKIITLFTSPYSGGGADGIQDTGKASPQKTIQAWLLDIALAICGGSANKYIKKED